MMLDRPSAKAVKVLSDITSQCHICSVPYLNNGTPLPLMLWHGQATMLSIELCMYIISTNHSQLLSRIVTVTVSSPITTFGLVEVITAVKCSVCSTLESSVIGTRAWAIVSPAKNTTVIGDDVKSDPAVQELQ